MIGLELVVKLRNLEYKQIAEYLEISPQTVSDWIKGKRKVPSRRVAQLSEYLNIKEELIYKELDEETKLQIHFEIINKMYDSKEGEVFDNDFNEFRTNEGENKMLEQLSFTDFSVDQYTTSDLFEQIKERKKEVKTDEIDFSISELSNMYLRGALDIHPEFQRLFRWSNAQKSRFIESILLGIPIPPIFVAEDEKSAWDVIDGVQRLSTILEFLGILRDDNGKNVPPSVLVGTKKLPALEGKVWNNEYHKYNFSFDDTDLGLDNKLLYSRLKIIRVSNDSDPDAKYDIFDRLNTGGSKLTHQEIRNCLAIMINREFYTYMRGLSYNENYINCMPLTDRLISEQAALEYVLRFIVYRNIDRNQYSYTSDIHELLTDKMKDYCSNPGLINLTKEKEVFEKTFELLNKSLGENAFKKFYPENNRFKGAIMLSSYEIIAIGISNNIDSITQLSNPVDYIRNKVRDLYKNSEYLELQTQKISSQRAVTRFSILTSLGTKYFKPV
ncbi:DUF262 domain-containing protein [Paenibacillus sp. Marseille-Q4541]|uniref:GmrSD restriction endonuclease domain-containing protein n=1 Tax=Paenibacillus sp. Marseille-Q4541 TaxID=2831522 RepID=UPI001BA4A4C2|nr:DUF262 domain-containing protein [Paenibacillus sp. Marseille-Q4541]